MNLSVFEDVVGGAAKTVFVHVTAGDAGLGTGEGGRKHPYYLARENGAAAAVRFMASDARRPAHTPAPRAGQWKSGYAAAFAATSSSARLRGSIPQP
jgi:hypothetical protein